MMLRYLTLAVALAVASGAAIAAVALTLDAFRVNEVGQSIPALREYHEAAEPVWIALGRLYRTGLPPATVDLPAGDPLPTLHRLRKLPGVVNAYHFSPDRRVTVPGIPGAAPPKDRHVVDLETWRPRLMTLYGLDPGKRDPRTLSRAQSMELASEAFDWDMKQIAESLSDYQRPESGWGYADVPHNSDSLNVRGYALGERGKGFLVVICSLSLLQTHPDADVLRSLGLQDKFAWDEAGRMADLLIQAPEALEFFAPKALWPRPAYRERTERLLAIRYWVLVTLLVTTFVLAASWALRQAGDLMRGITREHAQSSFVSAITHEMRIPLTTVKMYADMLTQGVVTEPEKRDHYLRTISQEADRLSRSIENVLDFSRISNRRRQYRFEQLSLPDIVGEATEASQGALAAAGMTVRVDVPADLTLMGDREALVQSLVNLLSNAAKYAKEGKRVEVSAAQADDSIKVSVRDFGPGIPERERKRVFRPFYRLGDELTRTAPGSGLGLALVKEYMAAHGGRVELQSRPGEGARFELVLPRSR